MEVGALNQHVGINAASASVLAVETVLEERSCAIERQWKG